MNSSALIKSPRSIDWTRLGVRIHRTAWRIDPAGYPSVTKAKVERSKCVF